MNASRTTTVQANRLSPADETKPGFRTKTISTRLPPEELAEVETAAERAGQPLSEWLRETALRAARERPADPIELVLAEVWAVRHTVLSLFHAGAKATVEGKPMLPKSVLSIRDQGDAKKLERARVLLADFLARPIGKDGEVR
ncbi:MAG: hypothetical protein WAM85_13165 [Terracidiphilus sp.]